MQKRYWLKGGILYTITGIFVVAIVMSLFLLEPWGWFESSSVAQSLFISIVFRLVYILLIAGLILFGPAWMAIAMDLGMRGIVPEASDYVVPVIFGIIFQLVYSFIIGALLGKLYSKFKVGKTE